MDELDDTGVLECEQRFSFAAHARHQASVMKDFERARDADVGFAPIHASEAARAEALCQKEAAKPAPGQVRFGARHVR